MRFGDHWSEHTNALCWRVVSMVCCSMNEMCVCMLCACASCERASLTVWCLSEMWNKRRTRRSATLVGCRAVGWDQEGKHQARSPVPYVDTSTTMTMILPTPRKITTNYAGTPINISGLMYSWSNIKGSSALQKYTVFFIINFKPLLLYCPSS